MAFIDTLPPYIRTVFLSAELAEVIGLLKVKLQFNDGQANMLETVMRELFEKKIQPKQLKNIFQERLGISDEAARTLEQQFFINIILPLSDFFGDHFEYYKTAYGDPVKALEESKTMPVLVAFFTDKLRGAAERIEQFQNNSVAEASEMVEFFKNGIADILASPDSIVKSSLNNSLILLFMNEENFHETLLKALYENEERIGAESISAGGQKGKDPFVKNWLQDFLGFSGGNVSNISIARYLTDSAQAKRLPEHAREALKRLFETFIVLKNFPESLAKTPIDEWKFIPFYLPEEEMVKVPQKMDIPTEPTSSVRDDKVAPTPTITIVEASEPMAKAALPLGGMVQPMAQPVEPLKEQAPIDFSVVADTVVVKSGTIISDDIRERVKRILETRVRNIRNDIDTRERLTAVFAEGGAGLAAEEAEKILSEAKKAQQLIADGKSDEYAPKKILSEAAPQAPAQVKEELPKMVIKEVGGVPMIVEKKTNGIDSTGTRPGTGMGIGTNLQVRKTEPDPNRVGSAPLIQAPVVPPVAVPPHLQDAKEISVTVQQSAGTGTGANSQEREQVQRTGPGTDLLRKTKPDQNAKLSQRSIATSKIGAEKKPIPDVKAMPRLVTVIDELRALTMRDIRRISQDPKAACQKIVEKINALAKESLSKRAEAINAWKESSAYALYLEIGQLNIGQDMGKIADERKAIGKEYLTAEEFDALLDLNEKLRF